MKWFSIAALFGCRPADEKTLGSLPCGPFEIRWEVVKSYSGAWFNLGGNPGAKVSTSYFSVYYQGKPVRIPMKEGETGQFWQALVLKDAPHPAILVGIHSMYLITEENGALKTQALHEQDGDFATFQWLDGPDGLPGDFRNVYLGDDSGSSRYLEGGRMLIVNKRTVLDVHTLQVYPFEVNTWERVKQLDDYNAFSSPVITSSPDKSQLVLIGSRSNPADYMLYQYALVVIDFVHNSAYSVPFDRTDTRFFSVWDGSPQWVNTYFQWNKGKDGLERLALRHFKRLPCWQGRWSYNPETGHPSQYKLIPVKKSMINTFVDFVKSEFDVKAVRTELTGDLVSTYITIDDSELLLYFNPEYQELTLNWQTNDLITRIGKRFDEELAKGRFEADFDRFE